MDMSALAGMMGGGGLPAGLDGMMNNPAMKEAMAKVRGLGLGGRVEGNAERGRSSDNTLV